MAKRIGTWSREGRIGHRRTGATEIVRDLEHELIAPGREGVAAQQGRVGTAIGVGRALDQQVGTVRRQAEQLQRDAACRSARHGIEDMRRQTPTGLARRHRLAPLRAATSVCAKPRQMQTTFKARGMRRELPPGGGDTQ